MLYSFRADNYCFILFIERSNYYQSSLQTCEILTFDYTYLSGTIYNSTGPLFISIVFFIKVRPVTLSTSFIFRTVWFLDKRRHRFFVSLNLVTNLGYFIANINMKSRWRAVVKTWVNSWIWDCCSCVPSGCNTVSFVRSFLLFIFKLI